MDKIIKYTTYLLTFEEGGCVEKDRKIKNICEVNDQELMDAEQFLINMDISMKLETQLNRLSRKYSQFKIELGIEEKLKLLKIGNNISNASILTVTYIIESECKGLNLNDFMVFDIKEDLNLDEIYEKVSLEIEFVREKQKMQLKKVPLEGEWNIVFNSEPASKLFHEILLHPFEYDFYDESFFPNQKIFSKSFSLVDNYNVKNVFDDMGNSINKNIPLVIEGQITGNKLGFETGNMYKDYFQCVDEEALARTTQSCITIDEYADLSSYKEYMIIEKIDSGYFKNDGQIYLMILNAKVFKNGKLDIVEPCVLQMEIKELVTKEIYAIGKGEWNKSLCMKGGQVHPVALKCPGVIIENVRFKQRGRVYDQG